MSVEATDDLTPMEREAIADWDAEKENGSEGTDEGDDDSTGDDTGDDEPVVAEAEVPVVAEAVAAEVPVPEVTTIPVDLTRIPEPPVVPVVDFRQQQFRFMDDGKTLPQYQAQLETLDNQFVEGEIGLTQYNQQRDELRAQSSNDKYSLQYQEWAGRQWQAECGTFYQHNPEWTQEKLAPVVWNAFNAEVIRLRDDQRLQGYSGLQVIYLAQQNLVEAFHMKVAAVPEVPVAATPVAKPVSMPRPAAKTLAHVPAADVNDTGGEFAAVDKLSGLRLEAELSKMSPEQLTRYLHGQG